MRKKYRQKTYIVLAFFTFLASVSIIVSINIVSGQQTKSKKNEAEERQAVRDAIRRGGYREAARVKGNFKGNFDPHWDWAQLDIESLTKYSEIVLVGVASKNLGSRLATQGQLIVTDYEVLSHEIIKGSIREGETIKVSLPGGRVQFEDGTSAELVTSGFQLEEGKTYVLFLFRESDQSDTFTLVAGPQGLFELPSDGKSINPSGRPTDPAVKETKNKDVKSFLKEIREHSRRWPMPGKCCG
ncbi:MAG TPA: hypothetical protein VGC66_09805 [Pyrinomonadaceae bacterium]|jgi:hypothetical protein